MLELESTKRKLFRVLLGLLISVSVSPAAFARGGGGGGGGHFSGGGHSGGSQGSMSMSQSAPSQQGGSSQSFAAPRGQAFGRDMRGSPDFSRAQSFSRERAGDMAAAPSERMNTRSFDRGQQFGSRFSPVQRSVGRDTAVSSRQFGQARQLDSVRGAGAPRVNREAIAPPLSQSLRTSRSTQIAQSDRNVSSTTHSRIMRPIGRDSRSNVVADTAGRHVAVSTATDRTSMTSRTARHGTIGDNRTAISGNHAVATNFSTNRNWSGSGQHGTWSGSWQHNNWNGSWSHNNFHHGDFHHGDFHHERFFHHHHHDFDDDFLFIGFGGFWPWWPWWWWGGWYPYWYPYYGYPYYGSYYGYDSSMGYPMDGSAYDYNNYGSDYGALQPGSTVNGMQVPDYNALSAVGQKSKALKPATESDKLFDEGVTAFGSRDYPTAIEKLRAAVRLEPDDTVLPFAYAQALFANNQYEQAAAVLSTTLAEMAPYKPKIAYPKGMYKDESILNAQVENLHRAVLMDPTNVQMQLLYGYQLLGIGKVDDAKVSLDVAERDARTQAPATALLDLLEQADQPSNTPAK